MQFPFKASLPSQGHHTRILNDQRIGFHFVCQLPKLASGLIQLIRPDDGVESHIHPHPFLVGQPGQGA